MAFIKMRFKIWSLELNVAIRIASSNLENFISSTLKLAFVKRLKMNWAELINSAEWIGFAELILKSTFLTVFKFAF